MAIGATDMRKGFEGLFGIVRDRLLIDPLSGHVFVFCNARKNRLKIFYWDGYVTFAIMGQMLCRIEQMLTRHSPG